MSDRSLHEIMNDIVGRLETLQPTTPQYNAHLTQKPKARAEPLSELQAFLHIDSLLAHLQKDYLDAKAQRKELQSLNGKDDPMVEIALDMEDSAWCAMQARYIEIRQVNEMMVKAQRLMREAEEAIEQETVKAREQQYSNFILLSRMQEKARKEKRSYIFEIGAYLMLLYKTIPALQTHDFSLQSQKMAV